MGPVQIIEQLNERDRIPVEAIHAAEADRPAAVAGFLDAIEQHLSPERDRSRPTPCFSCSIYSATWRGPDAQQQQAPRQRTKLSATAAVHQVGPAHASATPGLPLSTANVFNVETLAFGSVTSESARMRVVISLVLRSMLT
jgi:hypothetical protein